MTDMDIENVRTELVPIFARHHDEIVAAYLFGSTVKGATSPSSDIDIAVLIRSRPQRFFDAKIFFQDFSDILFKEEHTDGYQTTDRRNRQKDCG
jgi:predicted nucleotidyltransferase